MWGAKKENIKINELSTTNLINIIPITCKNIYDKLFISLLLLKCKLLEVYKS